MFKALFAVCLLPWSACAFSCQPLVEKVNARLDHPALGTQWPSTLSACAALGGKTVVGLAPAQAATGNHDLDILVVDSDGAILHRVTQSVPNGGPTLTALHIDTAHYGVAPGRRAFGLRASYDHRKRDFPHESEQLTLYLPEGKALQPILKDFETRDSSGESHGGCAYAVWGVERTISVGKPATGRFADLIVRARSSEMFSKVAVKGKCVEHKSPPKLTREVLRFDGHTYKAGRP